MTAAGFQDVLCPFGPSEHFARYCASTGAFLCPLCELDCTGSEVEAMIGRSVSDYLERQPGLLERDPEAWKELSRQSERAFRGQLRPSELGELLECWARLRWPAVAVPVHRAAIRRAAERVLGSPRRSRGAA